MIKILTLRTWYKVHKWTAIVTGLALVMWLITGVVMAVNWSDFFVADHDESNRVKPDFRTLSLSPAEAVDQLAQNATDLSQITKISMLTILDKAVYQINTADGAAHFVEADSGELFEITPEIAEQIARAEYPTEAAVVSIDRLNFNDTSYPLGPVPVYRVRFDDWQGTRSHVSIVPNIPWGANTGDIQRTNIFGRFSEYMHSLHTFRALRLVTDRGRLIVFLLWSATIATLFMAVVGYYLALPRRWQLLTRTGRRKRVATLPEKPRL